MKDQLRYSITIGTSIITLLGFILLIFQILHVDIVILFLLLDIFVIIIVSGLTWGFCNTWRERNMKTNNKKRYTIKLFGLSILIILCLAFLGCSFKIVVDKRETIRAREMSNLIPKKSLSIVAKHHISGELRVINECIDYYKIFTKNNSENKFLKRVNIKESGVVTIENLEPGLYGVTLYFAGIEIISRDSIKIEEDQGIYLELVIEKATGCFSASVFCTDTITPLPKAYVEIQTPDDVPVRGMETNNKGKTGKLWLWPTCNENDYYKVIVKYDNELVGELSSVKLSFQKSGEIKNFKIFTSVSPEQLLTE